MAGWPFIFGNLAGGNQPLSDLDANFTQVAMMIPIPCAAVGQNAIALTPIGNAPILTGYSNFNWFRALAAAGANAPITASFNSLAFLPVYKSDGVTQAGSGDTIAGQLYDFIFNQALNGGAGGFYLQSLPVPVTTVTAGGTFANLRVANNGANPDTRVDVSCDEVVMLNAGGAALRATGVSVTINMAVVGANGIDTGAQSAGGFYYIYLISNGSTTAGLASRSSTAPTMPATYTYKKRVGTMVMDLGAAQTSTVTISNASPCVIGWTAHGLPTACPVVFSGTSAPTGITFGQTYYVSPRNNLANSFQITANPMAGTDVNTSSAGTGPFTATVPGIRFRRTLQLGNRTQFVVTASSATPQLPALAGGTAGTYSTSAPVYVAVPVGVLVPPTAASIGVTACWNAVAGTSASIQVAPNTSYGGDVTVGGNIAWYDTTGSPNTPLPFAVSIPDMLLESTNIAWTSSGTAGLLLCRGYVDNL